MRQKKTAGMFYPVLAGIAAALLLFFLYVRLGMLRPWLTRYEAAQPKHACQEIFRDLFAPAEGTDWGRVYDLARLDGTACQDRESFVRSMEALTAGQTLTYVETSAGLSGDRRYIVKSGGDSIASFTLTGGGAAVWRLDTVEMLSGRTGAVTVRTRGGRRVLVNGRELSTDDQVQTIETVAERYLPEGVHGPFTVVWRTECGFSRQAEVRVLDGVSGQELPLSYDPEGDCFTEAETPPEIGGEEQALAIGAAETYARFMIREASAAQLQQYFDSSSQIYRTIRTNETWMQRNHGFSFADESVSRYCRYSEDVFSARVSLTLNVRRGDGTVRPYEVDSTFFFQRKGGVWRAFEMTNVDVQAEGTVSSLLVFMNGEEEIERLRVFSDETVPAFPVVPAPAGQSLAGWAVREQSGGRVTMSILFQPGEDGVVEVPENAIREPMTLYAVFA